MGAYKWYLLHQLFWSFVFDLHLSTWKPVTLWPFFMAYSAGWWSSVDGDAAYLPIVILNSIIAGMAWSLYSGGFHRYIQVAPLSCFYQSVYSNIWLRSTFYIVSFIGLQCMLALPMYLMKVPKESLKKVTLETAPQLKFFFDNEPSLAGYDRSLNNNMVTFTYALLFYLVGVSLSIVILALNYIRMLKKNENFLTAGTLKLQKMLFKTLLIQVIVGMSLLVVPIFLALTFSVLGYHWASTFTMFAVMVTATHAIVEYACIIYYIRPYRIFVKKLVYRILRRKDKVNRMASVGSSTSRIPTSLKISQANLQEN